MKISLLALALLSTLPLALCAQESGKEKAPAEKKEAANVPKTVTVEEAEKLIKETPGLIVLDVRTPEEFEHEHIKGAINLNVFGNNFDAEVAKLDQTKPVLVHCAAGRRSTMAADQLLEKKAKFPVIYNMTEGMAGWKKAGKAIEGKPLPREDKRPLPGQPKAK